ncbi:MAG: hypothetical protein ACHQFW_09295 [Chitinophagales bacterium]
MKKVFGHFFSILFIPLLLPLYGTLYVIYSDPYEFPDKAQNMLMILRVGFLTFVFPAITILLLVALKFIKSVNIYDRQERIVPYIAAGFFYIWAFFVFYKEGFYPQITYILLGSTIAVFVDFMINVLMVKVSMHATGAGGMIATILLLMPYAYYSSLGVLVATIIVAGCIGTARLALNAHSEREIYLGYLTGFFSFMVASNFFQIIS